MTRYLITTADERSWKFDRPVLFLGQWCLLYDRKQVWSQMDAVVAEPYGLEPGKKISDIDYVLKLTSQMLPEVAAALNKFHRTHRSDRYWNIVLGHWLQRYISVAFNRYHTLDQAIRLHKISGSSAVEPRGYSLATPDYFSFHLACDNDQWNWAFTSRLMAYRGDVELDVVSIKNEPETQGNHVRRWGGVKSALRNIAQTIAPKFRRSTDAFIIGSYLPTKDEMRLQLALGQVPQLWSRPFFKSHLPDAEFRSGLVLNHAQYSGFEKYVRWQLPEIIPTCYVEGYGNLVKTAEALPWPERPKFIFTSNNFGIDEVFKVWAGAKVEQGIPYFTGQHGGSYGTHIHLGNPVFPERSAADKFITWGWRDDNPNTAPAFIFTTASRKTGKYDTGGGLLLVELPAPYRVYPWDRYAEYCIYQEEQFRFVRSLPKNIQQSLTLRLHLQHKIMGWSDTARWKEFNPQIQIAADGVRIQDLISQNRLTVYSYDSTGILESLALNIPIICFWHGGLEHLLPQAKPYYELLLNAGILCDTPERAAEMAALHWDDVRGWWLSREVQGAREAFCNQYAVTVKRPIATLKKLLIQCAAEVVNERSKSGA